MSLRLATAALVLSAVLSAGGCSAGDGEAKTTGSAGQEQRSERSGGGGVGGGQPGIGEAGEGSTIGSADACRAWRETVVTTAQDAGIAVTLTETSNKGAAGISNSQGYELWDCSAQLTHPDGQRVTSIGVTVSVDPRVIEDGCASDPTPLLEDFPELAAPLQAAEEATGRTWLGCSAGQLTQVTLISLDDPGMWVASNLGTPTEEVGDQLYEMKREFLLAWLTATELSGLPDVPASSGTPEEAMRALLDAVGDGDASAASRFGDGTVVELLTEANADYGPLRLGTCQDESSPPSCTVFPGEPPGNINVEFERDGSEWRAVSAGWVME